MELQLLPVNAINVLSVDTEDFVLKAARADDRFITANTIVASLPEIRDKHIIPVFVKDNNTLISHSDFIDTAMEVVSEFYSGERILQPAIRLSHPIKGRIPGARDKPAYELSEQEKTLYYERMAFVIEVPSVTDTIGGNTLSLTIGGIKAYNLDNLCNRKGADEHFKIFAGFQNKVCTNMCVWTDGYMGDVRVHSIPQLKACIQTMLANYNKNYHLFSLKQLCNYSLTEKQFAQLIGRCRMYQHLPHHMKQDIKPLLLGDTQISTVCKDYYRDNSFCKMADGSLSLWRLYNLFTGANKSTYIDSFIDRLVNAFDFVDSVRQNLDGKAASWFLD